MTFEEYCNENTINYKDIIDIFDSIEINSMYFGNFNDKYHIGSIDFECEKESSSSKSEKLEQRYDLYIYKDNFKIEIINYVEGWIGINKTEYYNYFTFNSLKSALIEFKNYISNPKPYYVEDNWSKPKCRFKTIQSKTIDLVDRLLSVSNEDKSANNFKECIDFIDEDLTNVLLKNDMSPDNDYYLLHVNDNMFMLNISNKLTHNDYFKKYEYRINFSQIHLKANFIDDEDGLNITLDKTFSNLNELKQILQKIIPYLENYPFYKSLARDLQDIL